MRKSCLPQLCKYFPLNLIEDLGYESLLLCNTAKAFNDHSDYI